MNSSFFVCLDRIRWVKRWGLMRNQIEENVMEHSWQVATIAHTLAVIHNHLYAANINTDKVATLALYHDVSEVITGDMPTPIKYHSPTITKAYKAIEREAETELLNLLPSELQPAFAEYIDSKRHDPELYQFVKWADSIAAWLKCQAEHHAGNNEFLTAENEIKTTLHNYKSAEVDYFIEHFANNYKLNLDQLIPNPQRKTP